MFFMVFIPRTARVEFWDLCCFYSLGEYVQSRHFTLGFCAYPYSIWLNGGSNFPIPTVDSPYSFLAADLFWEVHFPCSLQVTTKCSILVFAVIVSIFTFSYTSSLTLNSPSSPWRPGLLLESQIEQSRRSACGRCKDFRSKQHFGYHIFDQIKL